MNSRRYRRLRCLLRRHPYEYLIDADAQIVVRWCPRCKNPKAADAYNARQLPKPNSTTPDRPLAELDHDPLSAAAGLLKALRTDDHEGFSVLVKHADPGMLLISLCYLAGDALAEPSSDDLAGYTDRLFGRLGNRT